MEVVIIAFSTKDAKAEATALLKQGLTKYKVMQRMKGRLGRMTIYRLPNPSEPQGEVDVA